MIDIFDNSYYDISALIFFIVSWVFYSKIASRTKDTNYDSLTVVLRKHRLSWMLQFLKSEYRIVDVTIINSLRASASFFASTSVLIIAGLITALASSEKGVRVLSVLPFVSEITRELWEIKMLLLIIVFVFAFLEFTWSIRMYNFSCVILGSAPNLHEAKDNAQIKTLFPKTASEVISLGSIHFNNGMRAYYFSLSALTWFISPIFMFLTNVGIIYILYRRDFCSYILDVLKQCLDSVVVLPTVIKDDKNKEPANTSEIIKNS